MYKSRVVMEEAQILNLMPPAMKTEFSYFIYAKYVSQVPLFRGLPAGVIQPLCNACQPMMAVKHQCIIEEGSTGTELYILVSGECEISSKNERLGFLADGAFFGEVPLLDQSTGAEVRMRTVVAMTDCQLCFLERAKIMQVKAQYPELGLRLVRCARVRKNQTVNRKGRHFKKTMDESADFRAKHGVVPATVNDGFKSAVEQPRAPGSTNKNGGGKGPFGGSARDRLQRAVKTIAVENRGAPCHLRANH